MGRAVHFAIARRLAAALGRVERAFGCSPAKALEQLRRRDPELAGAVELADCRFDAAARAFYRRPSGDLADKLIAAFVDLDGAWRAAIAAAAPPAARAANLTDTGRPTGVCIDVEGEKGTET